MDRKTFIRNSAFIGASLLVGGELLAQTMFGKSKSKINRAKDKWSRNKNNFSFVLPPLPYEFDAFEPFIDAKTMEIHYTKHHQAYVDNLNKALQMEGGFNSDLESLVRVSTSKGSTIRNNAGGHFNHSLFWQLLAPVKEPKVMSPQVTNRINSRFGSVEKMQNEFEKAALSVFGSGWAWLVIDSGQLDIVTTANQDNPLMNGVFPRPMYPVLCLDVWEHAYYLKYQNRRAEYVKNFWKIVNWDHVHQLMDTLKNH